VNFYASVWRCRGFSAPEEVDLKPTLKCNLKCRMCFQRKLSDEYRSRMYRSELSTERYLSLIEELAGMGTRRVHVVGGGEPLLRRDILEIMSAVKRFGMEGVLTTNGTLFTEDLIREIVRCGWDVVMFSVDGPNADVYEDIRGVSGSFDRVYSSMKSFSRVRAEFGVCKPLLHIHCVILNLNFMVIDKMIDLARDVGANIVTFDKYYPEYEDLILRKEDLSTTLRNLQKAYQKAQRYGIYINVEDFLSLWMKPSPNTRCYWPWLYADIDPNGDVLPCCFSHDVMGNIKKHSFRQIWDGEKYNNLRKIFKKKEFPDFCKDCTLYPGLINRIPLGKVLHYFRLV
jgi:radical SAM protein with 4Fe4S-binding SPASM domain